MLRRYIYIFLSVRYLVGHGTFEKMLYYCKTAAAFYFFRLYLVSFYPVHLLLVPKI